MLVVRTRESQSRPEFQVPLPCPFDQRMPDSLHEIVFD
jgi:hypothetical protein